MSPVRETAARALRAALATILLASGGAAAAQNAFAPIVVIDDRVVTNYELDQRMRLLVVNGAPRDAPNLQRIALDQLIEDRIKRAEAERVGVELSEDERAEAIAAYAAQRDFSPAQLDSALARAGVDRDALAAALETDLLWRNLVRRRFGARAEPTDAEIDQEIALAATGGAASYRIAEIALPFAARGEAQSRDLARRIAAELRAGGSFAAAARRYSAAASARQGGEVGWVPQSALPPAAATALAGLAVGEVSDPVDIPGGVAILRLLETRSEAASWATETEVTLLALSGADPSTLRARAAEAAEEAADCGEARENATAIGLEARPREATPVSALPGAVRRAISGLSVGAASAPVGAGDAATVYVLCGRSGGPSPEARERLRAEIRSDRLERFAATFLEELRADAVIERR